MREKDRRELRISQEMVSLITKLITSRSFFDNNNVLNSDGKRLLRRIIRIGKEIGFISTRNSRKLWKEPTYERIQELYVRALKFYENKM